MNRQYDRGWYARIDAALEHMKHAGVRCAFATDDVRHLLVGMITAYDITSEKPMRHIRSVDGRRQDVLVRDIMQKTAARVKRLLAS